MQGAIGSNAHAVIHRAHRGSHTVAVRFPHLPEASDDTEEQNRRFRRDLGALARLSHPAILTVDEIGEVDGQPYGVTEAVEGRTLATLLADGPLPEASLVPLASALAGALAELHRHGIVHGMVTPHQILIAASGAVTLIDFHLGMEGMDADPSSFPSVPSGTSAQPADTRADLSALGIVLVAGMTGSIPSGVVGLEQLLARSDGTPTLGAIEAKATMSPAFIDIVAKLLARDPRDRYRSAESVLADLQSLPSLNAMMECGTAITLGAATPTARPVIPLLGRDAERALLHRMWAQVCTTSVGATLLIEGEPGAGKSRLYQSMTDAVCAAGGFVLAGDCAEADPAPLAALQHALDRWLAGVRALPTAERLAEERVVIAAAGHYASLLTRFSPGLATLFAGVAPLQGIADASERYYQIIADFLAHLAIAQGGMLLALNDVQWLDETSYRVLASLAAVIPRAPLFLMLTARDDPPSVAAVRAVRLALGGACTGHIALPPLGESVIAALVAASLGGGAVDRDFVHRIATRSGGNPFVIAEYLRAMLETGLLRFADGIWTGEMDGLERLPLPADVVRLIVTRIEALALPTKDTLTIAAVMGTRFQRALLPEMCRRDAEAVAAALADATRAKLIEWRDESESAFLHDRIREALLSRLSASERQLFHARIAETLDAAARTDAAHLYAVARHYAASETARNPVRVYETNVAAGRTALTNFANEEAYRFLTHAARAAQTAALAVGSDIEEIIGEACTRTGRWTEAIAHLQTALDVTEDPVHRARLWARRVMVHIANRDTAEAWADLARGSRELGTAIPRAHVADAARTFRQWRHLTRVGRSGRDHTGSTRAHERERIRVLTDLSILTAQVAYFDNRTAVLVQAVIRSVDLALRLGPSHELITAYAGYTLLLALLHRPKDAGQAARKAIAIAEQIDDPAGLALASVAHAWATHVGGAPREAETMMRNALVNHGHWLDAKDYMSSYGDLCWNLLMRGYCREAWEWIQRAIRTVEATSRQRIGIVTDAAALLAVLGRMDESQQYAREVRNLISQTPHERWRSSSFLGRAVLVHLEEGVFGEAFEQTVAQFQGLGLRPDRASFHMRHFYVFHAYARLTQLMRAEPALSAFCRMQLKRALADLRRAATHPTLQCHLRVIAGAYERLEGRFDAALRLLAQAEALATETDNPWAHFEIARQRSHLFADRGETAAAHTAAQMAHDLATEHGWVNRAHWIEDEQLGSNK